MDVIGGSRDKSRPVAAQQAEFAGLKSPTVSILAGLMGKKRVTGLADGNRVTIKGDKTPLSGLPKYKGKKSAPITQRELAALSDIESMTGRGTARDRLLKDTMQGDFLDSWDEQRWREGGGWNEGANPFGRESNPFLSAQIEWHSARRLRPTNRPQGSFAGILPPTVTASGPAVQAHLTWLRASRHGASLMPSGTSRVGCDLVLGRTSVTACSPRERARCNGRWPPAKVRSSAL
jgi:hypothetical protein